MNGAYRWSGLIALYFAGLGLAAVLCFGLAFSSPTIADSLDVEIGAPPDGQGGDEFVFEHVPHLTEQQRAEIQAEVDRNIAELRVHGKLLTDETGVILFDWPLRPAPQLTDPGYHGTSGFVDHNPAYPNYRLDYNCGTRTYDRPNGYNHKGTDFFTWPFGWRKMDNDEVEVVASAAGTIVYRRDGYYDRSCGFNGDPANLIYLMHADGSFALYGHFKNGSVTPKQVGQTVQAGEYLGIVGSSGNSTGPHLHFEIYDSAGQLIDPFSGPCNSLNEESWWIEQPPYRDSAVNATTTGFAAPFFNYCPNPEQPNASEFFLTGDRIFFATYYHDQVVGQPSQYTIYRPDGSIYARWIRTSPRTYSASYWYWWWNSFAPNGPLGVWRFEVVFEGETYTRHFRIGEFLHPAIDVDPYDFRNLVKPVGAHLIAVALLGSEELDITRVDPSRLHFGPGEAAPALPLPDPSDYTRHLQDVNHDGYLDLISHYDVQETGIACGDASATLSGWTYDYQPFVGSDLVTLVGCGMDYELPDGLRRGRLPNKTKRRAEIPQFHE
jgi:murein DD-endopeptidase MepM/ murein hydrolase activator NlpD